MNYITQNNWDPGKIVNAMTVKGCIWQELVLSDAMQPFKVVNAIALFLIRKPIFKV